MATRLKFRRSSESRLNLVHQVTFSNKRMMFLPSVFSLDAVQLSLQRLHNFVRACGLRLTRDDEEDFFTHVVCRRGGILPRRIRNRRQED